MRLKKRFVALLTGFIITLSAMPSVFAFNLEAAQAYNKALDYYINGKTNDAITQFKQAISLDPEFTDAYYNLGSIYRYTNQFELAEEAFQKVLTLKSNDSSVNYDLALIYVQKNDYKRAISYLNLVKDNSERYQDAQNKLSMLNGELNSLSNTNAKLEQSLVKNLTEEKKVETVQPEAKKETQISTKPDQKKEKPKKIKKVKEIALKKSPKISKKERIEISKSLISNSFEEQPEQNQTKEEPEVVANNTTNIENNETSTPKINEYAAKYGTSSSKEEVQEETREVNNSNEEDIAVNYMAIEDTNYNKLTISPKESFIKATSNPVKENVHANRNQRNSIKTYASGFNGPTGIVRDSEGNLYVANYSENKIYKVTSSGQRTVYASSDDINGPIGMAIDNKTGNIFIANYLSNSITKITPDGQTFTIATGLNKPYFVYLDSSDSLYVSEQDSNSISVINLAKGKQ